MRFHLDRPNVANTGCAECCVLKTAVMGHSDAESSSRVAFSLMLSRRSDPTDKLAMTVLQVEHGPVGWEPILLYCSDCCNSDLHLQKQTMLDSMMAAFFKFISDGPCGAVRPACKAAHNCKPFMKVLPGNHCMNLSICSTEQ